MKSIILKHTWSLLRIRKTVSIKRQLPEEWNELTPHQVERIMALLYTPAEIYQTKLKCMRILLNISWLKFFIFLPEMKTLWVDEDGEPKTFLRIHTAFIFDHFTLTKNPFPSIKCRKTMLFGPRDYCEGLQTDEFITIENYFSDFINSKDEKSLDLIVATLYRPKGEGLEHHPGSSKFSGDIREEFNDKAIEKRLKWVKKIPTGKKYAVLSFYRSCRDIWEETYDLVFTGKSEGNGYGWFEMIKAVNPQDWGTIPEKEKTSIGNLLLSMQVDIRDAKKLKGNNKL